MDSRTLRILFGKRMRSLRKIRDLTQEALAENTGLSVEYISRIERGLASPSFDALATISNSLRVKPQSLFDFEQLIIDPLQTDESE